MLSLLFGSILLLMIIVLSVVVGMYIMMSLVRYSTSNAPKEMTAREWIASNVKRK